MNTKLNFICSGTKSSQGPANIHYPSPVLGKTSDPKPKPIKPVRYPSPDEFRYHGEVRTVGEGGADGGGSRIKYPDPEIRLTSKEKEAKVKNDVRYPHPYNIPHDVGE